MSTSVATSPSTASPMPSATQTSQRKSSICMKPLLTTSQPLSTPTQATVQTPSSLTSKEWVIPPRPKPGRKPATDTPPTKRKAQNRAAQRAFRERRAAKVGELEDQLKEVEDQYDQEQSTMKDTISRLEKEAERYRSDLAEWIGRCRQLETELDMIKSTRIDTVPLPPRTTSRYPQPQSTDTSIGCGDCTIDTRCRCVDEVVNELNHDLPLQPEQQEKRPASPAIHNTEKRIKLERTESLEVDFTTIYASKAPNPRGQVSEGSAVADPCGFCSDGTPCICAELATEHTQAPPIIQQLGQFTPPPGDGDVSTSRSAPPLSCANGPGTCAQCQSDPGSTLFCKSLAASRAQSQSSSVPQSGCCGGAGPNGVCCQAPQRATRSRTLQTIPNNAQSSVTLTCADAYTTLSRHPAYERASHEIGTWLPRLCANEATKNTMEGRPAMEIDAANVMAVLRDFDRRFGKEG